MATRKPRSETKRSRATGALFDSVVSLPIDGPRPIGRTGFVATPLVGKPPVSEAQRERSVPKKKEKPVRVVWDGAEQEAHELLEIADTDLRTDEKRKLIAARLRKIAQGPRKWGVLR